MKKLGYTFWREDSYWLGYLDEYPDYWTQGVSEEDLQSHLIDLFKDLSSGAIPAIRKHFELEFALSSPQNRLRKPGKPRLLA